MCLQLVSLERPAEEPTLLYHASKWEVPDIQWNPHPSAQNLIATIVRNFFCFFFLFFFVD